MKNKVLYMLLMDWDYEETELEGLFFTLEDALEFVNYDPINKTMGWIIK